MISSSLDILGCCDSFLSSWVFPAAGEGGSGLLLGARLRPTSLGQTEDPQKDLLSEVAPWTDKATHRSW